jgi:hypothetical protein
LTQKLSRPATLDDYPEEELEEIAKKYDIVYFLGVWQTGEYGVQKSVKLLNIDPCMKASLVKSAWAMHNSKKEDIVLQHLLVAKLCKSKREDKQTSISIQQKSQLAMNTHREIVSYVHACMPEYVSIYVHTSNQAKKLSTKKQLLSTFCL